MASAVKQLSIAGWLTALGLQDYQHLFHRYNSIEELVMLCEGDLKNLGVRNSSHRARMVSSLVMLREKLYQQRRTYGRSTSAGGYSKTPGTSPASSTSSSPASLISHPDYASLPNPPTNLNYADFVPIQIPFQQQPQQTLGYIQIMPDVTDTPESNQELYKYLWYHGNISRQKAENLVVNDGDFLLRDSISKPGEFVMTCAWRGAPLHFVVNKCMSTDPGGNVRTQYRFEEALFSRISELIQYYIANKKLISEMSGVRIVTPVNRTATTHIDGRTASSPRGIPMSSSRSAGMSPRPSPFGSPSTTPSQSPVLGRRVVLPRRRGSQPLLDQDYDGGQQDGVQRKTSVPLCEGSHHHDASPHRKHSAPLLDIHRSNTSPLLHTCAQESFSLCEAHREAAASSTSLSSSHQKTTSLTSLTSHGRAKFSICEVHEQTCSSSSISSAGNTPSAQTPPTSFRSHAVSSSNSSLTSPCRSGSPKQMGTDGSRESLASRPLQPALANVSTTERVTKRSHTPPPKPSRTPTVKSIHRPRVQVRNNQLYEDDGKDYTDYDQVKSWPEVCAAQQKEENDNEDSGEEEDYDNNFGQAAKFGDEEVDYDVPKASKQGDNQTNNNQAEAYDVPPKMSDIRRVKNSSVANVSASDSARSSSSSSGIEKDEDFSELPMKLPKITVTLPDLDAPSMYNLTDFTSAILPTENKPLQDTTMKTIKQMLLEGDARHMAEHITQIDLQCLKVIGTHDLGVGVFSGLEHITLPQGSQLRKDLIERYECLSRFVPLTILICAKYPERASLLHKWIQIANELRGTLGNLYGFSAVMNGLRSPPVTRIRNSWISVKHNYPASSFLYESKLMPAIRSMDEGSSSLPLQNVTIPHIIPLIKLLERDTNDVTIIAPWEDSTSDYGLDIILAHLDTARLITEQYGLYRVTSENILREFNPQKEVLEAFSTELHLKFLWGARGAGVGAQERFNKFDQVLNVLSERAEPPSVIPSDNANETSV